MASNTQKIAGNAKGIVRQLQVKLDLLAVYIANKNFVDLGSLANYTTDYKAKYPVAPKHTGTVATNVFTTTGLVADAYVGKWAFFFKQEEITPLETADDLPKIRNLPVDIRKITENTTTEITVTGNIATGTTDVIVMDDLWWTVAQMQDFTFDEAVSMISANHQGSGEYEVSIPGLKNANITANGIFFPDQHTLTMLNLADSSDIRDFRIINTPYKYDKVVKGSFYISKFSKASPVDGSDIIKYNLELGNSGAQVTAKVIMADNTIPDFMA